MSETGDKLNAAYRAMPREEPGAAIDAAILAASRRALAKPSLSRRWAAPVSIAAVLVLAFGVTLHMQHEKPGIESPASGDPYSAPAEPTPPEPPSTVQSARPAARAEAPAELDAKAKLQREAAPPPQVKKSVGSKPDQPRAFPEEAMMSRDEQRAPPERKDLAASANLAKEAKVMQAPPVTTTTIASAAAPPPPAPAAEAAFAAPAAPARAAAAPRAPASEPAAPPPSARMKRESASAGIRGMNEPLADSAIDEPTRELEAIAKMRAEGRNGEADKALAEFRRKRPDYRIPEAMWERVKPR